jgi:hypothetical protein
LYLARAVLTPFDDQINPGEINNLQKVSIDPKKKPRNKDQTKSKKTKVRAQIAITQNSYIFYSHFKSKQIKRRKYYMVSTIVNSGGRVES